MTSANLKPIPLPPQPETYDIWQRDRPQYLIAYNLAFHAEAYAIQQTDPPRKNNIIFARVVGFLLVELFNRSAILTEGPCKYLSNALQSDDRDGGTTNDVVFKMGKLYCYNLLRVFRTVTTPYPTPSLHPSRPSFDTMEEILRGSMDPDTGDYRSSKRKVLERDGYRCLVTGNFDERSVHTHDRLREEWNSLDAGIVSIAACHILNASTMRGVDPTGASEDNRVIDKTSYASTAMAILDSFGFTDVTERFLPENGVHDLTNLLSLDPVCHHYFDDLNLWFEHTEEPNRYYVCVAEPLYEKYLNKFDYRERVNNRRYVTFSQIADNLKLPDPRLLALHAACARVAHMSGAAEAFDEVDRDVEDTRVLAFNGSSARLLDHLLTPFVAIPGVA